MDRVYTVQKTNGGWILKGTGLVEDSNPLPKQEVIKNAKARTNPGDTVHIKSDKGYVKERFTRVEHTPLTGFFAPD